MKCGNERRPVGLFTLWVVAILAIWAGIGPRVVDAQPSATRTVEGPPAVVRFATFNASLNRRRDGQLLAELRGGASLPARKIAAIVQHVRPDVLLINEFDGNGSPEGLRLFRDEYLAVGQFGESAIDFPFSFTSGVNTGVASGLDLNGDRKTTGPEDAFGFGAFPGQYGMLVYSRLPIVLDKVRTFQRFLWRDMPNAAWPVHPESQVAFYSDQVQETFRLSSKSHWDLPIRVGETTVHFLVCHPTPPVFDGPEDRNGRRNHDEIRLFADYVNPAESDYVYDDAGRKGGLTAGARFVVAGDLNADPHDGDSADRAILQLLKHPQIVAAAAPRSSGGAAAAEAQAGANAKHVSDPAEDTADFPDRETGNLRADYVLPSANLTVGGSGVFWPTPDQHGAAWVTASDHRLVWVDVIVE